MEIQLHFDGIDTDEGLTLSKAGNHSTSLLGQTNGHRAGKSQEHRHTENHTIKKIKQLATGTSD
jgi:hypothetical protein